MDAERVALGPPGLAGRTVPGPRFSIRRPVFLVCPSGAPLDFRGAPTRFTGADVMAVLPAIRAGLARSLAIADPTVQQIQIPSRQSPAIFPVDVPNPSAVHMNAGLQRELGPGMVLSADIVYRPFVDVPQNGGGSFDVNHFNSVRGPVIPECVAAQARRPARAVLTRSDQRLRRSVSLHVQGAAASRREAFVEWRCGSSARMRIRATPGTNTGNGFNLDNWLENTGPAPNDFTHLVNVAGVTRVAGAIELGLNFAYASAPPFSAFIGGIDFNGDGTDRRPAAGHDGERVQPRHGTRRSRTARRQFNQAYAGTTDAQGAITALTLPPGYAFGDNFHALDLRLSRSFGISSAPETCSLIGEAFNVYNAANLFGYSGDLTSAALRSARQPRRRRCSAPADPGRSRWRRESAIERLTSPTSRRQVDLLAQRGEPRVRAHRETNSGA